MPLPARNPLSSSLTCKLLPLNAKGINTPEKRSEFLRFFSKSRAHVVFLQETHFRTDAIPRISDRKYPTVFHSTSSTSKTKGVSILIAATTNFEQSDVYSDPEGRYLPQHWTIPVLTLTMLLFTQLFGRDAYSDLNLALNPLLDCSSGKTALPYRCIRSIKQLLTSFTLHDSWRFLHPNTKDYTFFSHPHDSYSRLDYFLISQRDLPMVVAATIEPMTLSDHSPITLTLCYSMRLAPAKIWRLQRWLNWSFSLNKGSCSSPLMLWEAHKSVIRGEFLNIQARLRKRNPEQCSSLLSIITALEALHKQSLARENILQLSLTPVQNSFTCYRPEQDKPS